MKQAPDPRTGMDLLVSIGFLRNIIDISFVQGRRIHFSDWGGGGKLEKLQKIWRALRANFQYNILRIVHVFFLCFFLMCFIGFQRTININQSNHRK